MSGDVRLSEAIASGLRKCAVEDGAPVRLLREDDVYHITHMVVVEVERLLADRLAAERERIAQAIEAVAARQSGNAFSLATFERAARIARNPA